MTPLEVCHDIARRNGSPLYLVSRLLGAGKRRLFLTAYAAMRVVDDLVDEDFLDGDAEGRAARRGEVLTRIALWREQALACVRGAFQPGEAAFAPMVFQGLNETLGASDLGEWPWVALAAAMEHDVREQEIVTWEDFLGYCEGATVAPATTFAYILACEERGGRFRLERDPAFCRDRVRSMAVFCYLMHILRDLSRDARRHVQLITIPRTTLAEAGLRREELAAALQRRDPAVGRLVGALNARAGELLVSGREAIAGLPLNALERVILGQLLVKYIDFHERLRKDPAAFHAISRPGGAG
ncbi:MAG: squalene/phytoene synthase family protein [Magnetococcales bacterium]|nr:squalene/phytoene synthase family protein [Magnetococcales bacterium]